MGYMLTLNNKLEILNIIFLLRYLKQTNLKWSSVMKTYRAVHGSLELGVLFTIHEAAPCETLLQSFCCTFSVMAWKLCPCPCCIIFELLCGSTSQTCSLPRVPFVSALHYSRSLLNLSLICSKLQHISKSMNLSSSGEVLESALKC